MILPTLRELVGTRRLKDHLPCFSGTHLTMRTLSSWHLSTPSLEFCSWGRGNQCPILLVHSCLLQSSQLSLFTSVALEIDIPTTFMPLPSLDKQLKTMVLNLQSLHRDLDSPLEDRIWRFIPDLLCCAGFLLLST